MLSVVNKTVNSAVVQSKAVGSVDEQTGRANNKTYRTLSRRLG